MPGNDAKSNPTFTLYSDDKATEDEGNISYYLRSLNKTRRLTVYNDMLAKGTVL